VRRIDQTAHFSDFPEAVVSRSGFSTGTAEGRSHEKRGTRQCPSANNLKHTYNRFACVK
jgi:hypothetical protein